jgi:DNA-directed RNA polymerase, mitochondrial
MANSREELVPDVVPEVRPAPQKGLGLTTLKESLSLFSGNSQLSVSYDPDATPAERGETYARMRQERLERDAITSALERWRKENDDLKAIGIDPSLRGKSTGGHLWTWCEALAPKIRAELRETEIAEEKPRAERTDKDRLRCEYGPFLGLIPAERLAALTIIAMLKRITRLKDKYSTLASVSIMVGSMVAREHEAEVSLKFRDANAMNPRHHNSRSLTPRGEMLAKMLRRKMYKRGEKYAAKDYIAAHKESPGNHGGSLDDGTTLTWTKEIQARLGVVLVSLLIDSATVAVPEEGDKSKKPDYSQRPVFTHDIQYWRGKPTGIIRTLPIFLEKLAKEPQSNLLSKQLPMVCEPSPWKNIRGGGFLTEKYDILRSQEPSQLRYAQAAADKGDLEEFFAGMDVLGRTPWMINRAVLKIMVEAWNSGKEIANFKAETPDIEYPLKPEDMDDVKLRKKYFRQIVEADNLVGGYHSQRCFHNLQLEIAKGYQNETFYFPHNADFRGRAYPLSAYLNQMGADHCRGLLMFGKGKALGSSGLRWLKIHLANVFGYDKASLQEREDFATTHLADIYDTASNPLNGKKWWLEAEDPWQTLATCMELKKALDSPDPSAYVSHFPIHQDGSCNGLQHYAALGGDLIGAQQVNLEPGERPADVYSGVAEMVKKEIDEDAAAGVQIAKDLQGKLTRKVVKQPVMTNVYGVTFIGAKAQVEKQLAVLFPGVPRFGDGFSYDRAAFYITKKIFKSMSAMFTGAHEIQYWLGLCGNRISLSLSPHQIDKIEREMDPSFKRKPTMGPKVPLKHAPDFKTSIIWTTPLKLPVVQPYRKNSAKLVKTILQTLTIQSPNSTQCVDKRRQLQAFPPNFIHSLDATHMLLSALKCNEVGLTFAAVHDSFWTHPSDIDTLSSILRDAFIRMHSDDIVGRLAAEFNARYRDYMYMCQIPSHSEVGKRIKAYRNTLKGTKRTGEKRGKFVEVVQERKRLRLLASDNPKEVEEGKAMVTAGSIFAEHLAKNKAEPISTAEIVSVESDVVATQIGHVPKTAEQMEGAAMVDQTSSGTEPKELKDFFKDGADMDGEAEASAEDDADAEAGYEDDEMSAAVKADEAEAMNYNGVENGRKTKQVYVKGKSSKTWVWLPLTFPDVPRKGEFDVKRLKESTYFFS